MSNRITTNVGNLENKGFEFEINGRPISKTDMSWEIGFNLSYNENEITKLLAVDDPDYTGIDTGDISGGVGNQVQNHQVGYAAYSYLVYEQVYDESGAPVEGLYVDRNEDGTVDDDDKYYYKDPTADLTFGISSKFNYKNWDLSLSGRASFGNYVYNNVDSDASVVGQMYYSEGYATNKTKDALNTMFDSPCYLSDYYVQDGSFFKLDNVTVGYQFNKLFGEKGNLRVYGTVQNVFTITDYSGLDPEIYGGIDNNVYPRPRTFLVGVNLDF